MTQDEFIELVKSVKANAENFSLEDWQEIYTSLEQEGDVMVLPNVQEWFESTIPIEILQQIS
jgi:HPt (histidine-containing phosphotransfer) domain-containing protein